MQLRRTGNAGVLLELDGVRILLDGVCRPCGSYLETPPQERENLLACPPDLIAFTHGHLDHFDRSFAQAMYHKTLRPVLGPEGLLKEGCICEPVTVGSVTVTPVPSRHIGKAGQGESHVSFLIRGSKQVLFTGDAAPASVQQIRADLLIAPYAYGITPAGWRVAAEIAPRLVLLHLPQAEQDPDGLWDMVKRTVCLPGPALSIPEMGQTIIF